MNQLEYKGYKGSIEVCLDDDLLHGKLLGIKDLVTYEGYTVQGIRKAFDETRN